MQEPTAFEQALLEMINRARLDPQGEFDELIENAATGQAIAANVTNALSFFGTDLDVLQTQLNSLSPVAPVAWNESLAQSAETHSQLMINEDEQSHNLPNEPSLLNRVRNAGYDNLSSVAENIFAFGQDPVHTHAAFYIDWGSTPTGIQQPAGHRNTIMNPAFTETGLGVLAENNGATSVGPFAITQHFGNRFTYSPQLLGVVTDDRDNDNQYDIGEGLGGVTVTAVDGNRIFETTTWDSGGYQMELPAGTYQVTFSGGGLQASVLRTVTFGANNQKLDIEFDEATNAAPEITGLSKNSIDENSANGRVVGQLAATDPNGDALSFGLTNDAGGLFALIADQIVVNGGLDFETATSHQITVEVRDSGGLTDTQTFTIQINDVDDNPDPGFVINGTADDETLVGSVADDTISGAGGNDVVSGGDGNDDLNGGGGDDQIAASEGNDLVSGGAGHDNLGGGVGNDSMDGGSGNDTLGGGQGNDNANGGDDDDVVNGGAGDDILSGDLGNDTIGAGFNNDNVQGGDGNDSLGGGTGRDTVEGGAGNDSIGGGEGDDIVNGDGGNDFLAGGGRNDVIDGGTGQDLINGGDGDDTMTGGGGGDVFVFNYFNGGEEDLITDFEVGVDSVRIRIISSETGQPNIDNGGDGLQGFVDDLNITDTAGGARLNVDGHLIFLQGIDAAQLGIDDFMFV